MYGVNSGIAGGGGGGAKRGSKATERGMCGCGREIFEMLCIKMAFFAH